MTKLNRTEACVPLAFRPVARCVAIAFASTAIACGGASGADTNAQSIASRWGGYWSCEMQVDNGRIFKFHGIWLKTFGAVVMTHDANGQTKSVSGLALYRRDGPIGLDDWLSSCLYYSIVDSSNATAGSSSDTALCSIAMPSGSVAISADANTLTIDETGKDATTATAASMNATCRRTGPADLPSTSGSSSGGSSGGHTPECTHDSDCGSCAMCSQGQCDVCPIGSLGICTC